MLSTVLILPNAQVATGNAVAQAMGWGPSNYSIALSANGTAPATHYGLHAWASEDFRQMVETGYYPPELAQVGITEAAFQAMLAALISSFLPDYMGHFDSVTAANGLQVVIEE
jgi:hypothetical protein